MAYADRTPSRNRTAIVVAVGAIHAAAFYALVTGLGGGIKETWDPPLTGQQIPLEPLPPSPMPEVKPSADPQPKLADPVFVPLPRVAINPAPDERVFEPLPPLDLPTAEPQPLPRETVTPTPTPSFTAKAAVPRGRPGEWVTPADYPARELREERQGTVRFRLAIGADGKVQGCEIVASSGVPGLDAATCRMLPRRARFEAASDGQGRKIASTYENAVTWVIPRD
jgi:periplasmic protein TonB